MKWATARYPKAWKTRPGSPRPIARKLRSRSPRSEFPGGQPRTSRTKPEDFALMSDSAPVMPEHPPVTDWVHDFDHTDPRWTENPYPIWNELRAASPVVHTERFLGCYMPTTYEAVREIAHDTHHFSSRRVIVRDVRPEVTNPAPPITSDPPKHIPVRAIAHMLGIPEKDGDLFIKWIHEILELGIKDDDTLMRAVHEMTAYFAGHIEHRKTHRTDDLISTLMHARDKNGQPLSDAHVLGSLRLLLIAGIDTTWSAIGSSLWHLARTPADRERLVREPELMPTAVEELLRAYSPVTMAREVMKETTISGCPVKPGNMVLLSFPAANRDPRMFPDADKVVLDRRENRHAAFGLGIHRCVGSNLARMEMQVAIEEWLKRIPDFRLDPAGRVAWSEGTVRGPRRLPMLFGKVA